MIDDFVTIGHDLAGRDIKVWCVADVHIGSAECDMDGFKGLLRRVLSDPQHLVLEFRGSNNADGQIRVVW